MSMCTSRRHGTISFPRSDSTKSWGQAAGAGAFSMTEPSRHTASELLAILASRQLKEGQVVFAGIGVPLLAATLAQRLRCPGLTILFEGGVIGAFVEPGK